MSGGSSPHGLRRRVKADIDRQSSGVDRSIDRAGMLPGKLWQSAESVGAFADGADRSRHV
jgi:hypothetical protein